MKSRYLHFPSPLIQLQSEATVTRSLALDKRLTPGAMKASCLLTCTIRSIKLTLATLYEAMTSNDQYVDASGEHTTASNMSTDNEPPQQSRPAEPSLRSSLPRGIVRQRSKPVIKTSAYWLRPRRKVQKKSTSTTEASDVELRRKTQKKALQVFTGFADLPTEIRLRIYQLALNVPQVIQIRPLQPKQSTSQILGPLKVFLNAPTPLLKVNRESIAEAMRVQKLLGTASNDNSISIHANLAIDTVWCTLPGPSLLNYAIQTWVPADSTLKLRKFALDLNEFVGFSDKENLQFLQLIRFSGIEEVSLVPETWQRLKMKRLELARPVEEPDEREMTWHDRTRWKSCGSWEKTTDSVVGRFKKHRGSSS